MEREARGVPPSLPAAAALPTPRPLPLSGSWSQEGLWGLGSLGTDWQQGAFLKFWCQEPRPLALIQRPRARSGLSPPV